MCMIQKPLAEGLRNAFVSRNHWKKRKRSNNYYIFGHMHNNKDLDLNLQVAGGPVSLHFLSLVFWFHSIIQRITHPFVPKCLTKEASSSHPSQSGEVNPFQMAKQITQPVRESPASPQSKLISAISLFCSLPTTCICVCIPTNKHRNTKWL